jgi:hypothetical protein
VSIFEQYLGSLLSKNNFSLDSIWEIITCLKGATTPSPFEKGDRGGFSEPFVKSPHLRRRSRPIMAKARPPFCKGGLTEKDNENKTWFFGFLAQAKIPGSYPSKMVILNLFWTAMILYIMLIPGPDLALKI